MAQNQPNELVQGILDAIAGGALGGLSLEAQQDFLSPFLKAQQTREGQKVRAKERAEDLAIRKGEREEDKNFQLGRDAALREHQLELEGTRKKEARSTRALDTYLKTITARSAFGSKADFDTFALGILKEAKASGELSGPQLVLLQTVISESGEKAASRNTTEGITRWSNTLATGEFGTTFESDYNTDLKYKAAVNTYIGTGQISQQVEGLILSTRAIVKQLAEQDIVVEITDPNFIELEKYFDAFNAENGNTAENARNLLTALHTVDIKDLEGQSNIAQEKGLMLKASSDVEATLEAEYRKQPDFSQIGGVGGSLFAAVRGPERFDYSNPDLFVRNTIEKEVGEGFTMTIADKERESLVTHLFNDMGYYGANDQFQRYEEAHIKIPDSMQIQLIRHAIREGEVTSERSSIAARRSFQDLTRDPLIRKLMLNPYTALTGTVELLKQAGERDPEVLKVELKELKKQRDLIYALQATGDESMSETLADLEQVIMEGDAYLDGVGKFKADKDLVYQYAIQGMQLMFASGKTRDAATTIKSFLDRYFPDPKDRERMKSVIETLVTSDYTGPGLTAPDIFANIMLLARESNLFVEGTGPEIRDRMIGLIDHVTGDITNIMAEDFSLKEFREDSIFRGLAAGNLEMFEGDFPETPLQKGKASGTSVSSDATKEPTTPDTSVSSDATLQKRKAPGTRVSLDDSTEEAVADTEEPAVATEEPAVATEEEWEYISQTSPFLKLSEEEQAKLWLEMPEAEKLKLQAEADEASPLTKSKEWWDRISQTSPFLEQSEEQKTRWENAVESATNEELRNLEILAKEEKLRGVKERVRKQMGKRPRIKVADAMAYDLLLKKITKVYTTDRTDLERLRNKISEVYKVGSDTDSEKMQALKERVRKQMSSIATVNKEEADKKWKALLRTIDETYKEEHQERIQKDIKVRLREKMASTTAGREKAESAVEATAGRKKAEPAVEAKLIKQQESWRKFKKPTLVTPSKFIGFPGGATAFPLVRGMDPDNPEAESNVLLGTFEIDEDHIVAPTMRNGKKMSDEEIFEMIFTESVGFGNTRYGFPKFKTEKAAQAWIKKNHGKISEDGKYTGRGK